jgi:thiamine biosynthesis lipoprotein
MKHSNLSSAKLSKHKTLNYNFEAIGTDWCISFYRPKPKPKMDKLIKAIKARIEVFDSNYSRFRNDSWVHKMSMNAGTYELPEDAYPMLELYNKLYKITNGKMTPLIGQVLVDAGYDSDYTLKAKRLQSPPSWDSILKLNNDSIDLTSPALLDFGAIGKGYLVDIITKLIIAAGLNDFCVNGSGDMYYSLVDLDPHQVGLEDPDHIGEIIGVANLKNYSICGSASNRRRWTGYNHIIDPVKLESPGEIKAIWVVAETAMLADALTTALCFIHADKLKQYFDFECALVFNNREIVCSENFPGIFFASESS